MWTGKPIIDLPFSCSIVPTTLIHGFHNMTFYKENNVVTDMGRLERPISVFERMKWILKKISIRESLGIRKEDRNGLTVNFCFAHRARFNPRISEWLMTILYWPDLVYLSTSYLSIEYTHYSILSHLIMRCIWLVRAESAVPYPYFRSPRRHNRNPRIASRLTC